MKPFPWPPVQLSDGISVSKENKQIITTKMFAGRNKSKILLPEKRDQSIPAEMQPNEIKIK